MKRIVILIPLVISLWTGCNLSKDLHLSLYTPIDSTPPIIDTTLCNPDPTTTATIARNSSIIIGFSEQMDPSTINSTTFTITDTTSAALISGSIVYDPATLTAAFTPVSLIGGDTYTVTLDGNVTDAAGNVATGLPFSYSFIAQTFVLSATTPAMGATNVLPSQTVSVTFNEPVNTSLLSSTISSWASITDSSGARTITSAGWNAAKTTVTFVLSGSGGNLTFNNPGNPAFATTVTLINIPSSIDGATINPSFTFTTVTSWQVFPASLPVDIASDTQTYVLRNGSGNNVYIVWEKSGTVHGRLHDGLAWSAFIPSPYITSLPASPTPIDAFVLTSLGIDTLFVGYIDGSGYLQFYRTDGSYGPVSCGRDATLGAIQATSFRIVRDPSDNSVFLAVTRISGPNVQTTIYNMTWDGTTLGLGASYVVSVLVPSIIQSSFDARNRKIVYGEYDGSQTNFYYAVFNAGSFTGSGLLSSVSGKAGGSALAQSSSFLIQYLNSSGDLQNYHGDLPPATSATTAIYTGNNSKNSALALVAASNVLSSFVDATNNTLMFYHINLLTWASAPITSSTYSQTGHIKGVMDNPVQAVAQPDSTDQIIIACIMQSDGNLHLFRSW